MTIRPSLPHAIAAVVLVIFLAACGMQPTPPPSPPPTRLPPTVSATPLGTPRPTPLPPVTPTPLPAPTLTPFPLPVRSATACGGIEIRDGVIVNPATAADAEECFWQAYQVCAGSEPLYVVHTRTDTPSYANMTYHLMNTGGRCMIAISGSAVPVVVDAQGTRTIGGAPIGDRCTGMSRDTLGDLLFIGCGEGKQWDLMTP